MSDDEAIDLNAVWRKAWKTALVAATVAALGAPVAYWRITGDHFARLDEGVDLNADAIEHVLQEAIRKNRQGDQERKAIRAEMMVVKDRLDMKHDRFVELFFRMDAVEKQAHKNEAALKACFKELYQRTR